MHVGTDRFSPKKLEFSRNTMRLIRLQRYCERAVRSCRADDLRPLLPLCKHLLEQPPAFATEADPWRPMLGPLVVATSLHSLHQGSSEHLVDCIRGFLRATLPTFKLILEEGIGLPTSTSSAIR